MTRLFLEDRKGNCYIDMYDDMSYMYDHVHTQMAMCTDSPNSSSCAPFQCDFTFFPSRD